MKGPFKWNVLMFITLESLTLTLLLSSLGEAFPQNAQYGSLANPSDLSLLPRKRVSDQNQGLDGPSKVVQLSEDKLQNLNQQSEDEVPNYDFKYQVHGGGNYFGHQESRREEKTIGQYHVLLPDGRRQTVTYYVDETGYHPIVTYELVKNGIGNVEDAKKIVNKNSEGYRSKRSRHYRHSKRVWNSKLISAKNI